MSVLQYSAVQHSVVILSGVGGGGLGDQGGFSLLVLVSTTLHYSTVQQS